MDKRAFIRNQACSICGQSPPSDPAHLKSKGAGAKNEEYEMIPLCREHHTEQHWKGWPQMVAKYPQLKRILFDKGWSIQDNFGIEKLVFEGTSHWERVEDY